MKQRILPYALIGIATLGSSCTQIPSDEMVDPIDTFDYNSLGFNHQYYAKIGVITSRTEYNSKGRVRLLSDGTYLTCMTPSPHPLEEGARVRIGRFDRFRKVYIVAPLNGL